MHKIILRNLVPYSERMIAQTNFVRKYQRRISKAEFWAASIPLRHSSTYLIVSLPSVAKHRLL